MISQSYNLGKTRITDQIRISSAAIHYEAAGVCGDDYFQYETFIFSDDPRQRTRHVIHGTAYSKSVTLEEKTKKAHAQICANLCTLETPKEK